MGVQVNVDNYQEWIRLVAEYTVQSLKAWQWASGSIHYLLGLWSRLVSSAAYLKGDAPSLLDTFAPQIIEAYVSSRCSLESRAVGLWLKLLCSDRTFNHMIGFPRHLVWCTLPLKALAYTASTSPALLQLRGLECFLEHASATSTINGQRLPYCHQLCSCRAAGHGALNIHSLLDIEHLARLPQPEPSPLSTYHALDDGNNPNSSQPHGASAICAA